MIVLRISLPSAGLLCAKEPLEVKSIYNVDSLPDPHKNVRVTNNWIRTSKDNWAQAAPADSFLSRQNFHSQGTYVRKWKECKTKSFSKIITIPVRAPYDVIVPLLRLIYKRERKQLPFKCFVCHT